MSSEPTQTSGPKARSASVRPSGGPGGVGDEHPIQEMLRIALPAVVTMMSYVVMQFVDMLIVSGMGPDALSAVGNGGIAAFVMAAFVFGMLGVITTYASQNLGAGHPERSGAYAWAGLWVSFLAWVGIMLPAALFLGEITAGMRSVLSLESDPSVARMEIEYGSVLLAGMFFTIAARGTGHFFYGVHRAKTVMVGAILGNVVNLPLTWCLVFGKFGMPEMGVQGAAIGTVVGSIVEWGVLMVVFLSPAFDREFHTRRSWRFSGAHIRDIWRIGWPGGVQLGNELVCWWVFMTGFVANFGVAHNAAAWITLRYMHVSFMPAFGISTAVTAIVGKKVGQQLPDLAASRAWLGARITVIYMGACALLFLIFRHELVGLFVNFAPADALGAAPAEDVIRIGGQTLVVAAVMQVFDALAIIMIGALRGAGDAIWPGVVTAVTSWLCIVGGGFLASRMWPAGGSIGPWIAVALYFVALALLLVYRFQSGRWRSMAVVQAEKWACIKCGHDLGGIDPEGACPECGTECWHSLATGDRPLMPPEAGAGVVPEVAEID
ncbi:MAG: MATE family efflux transporter [Phycisphaerales bacterium]